MANASVSVRTVGASEFDSQHQVMALARAISATECISLTLASSRTPAQIAGLIAYAREWNRRETAAQTEEAR